MQVAYELGGCDTKQRTHSPSRSLRCSAYLLKYLGMIMTMHAQPPPPPSGRRSRHHWSLQQELGRKAAVHAAVCVAQSIYANSGTCFADFSTPPPIRLSFKLERRDANRSGFRVCILALIDLPCGTDLLPLVVVLLFPQLNLSQHFHFSVSPRIRQVWVG